LREGPPRALSGTGEKKNLGKGPPPPNKGGPAKNLCTKQEILTVSYRVNWA